MDLDRISRVGTDATYRCGAVLKKYFGRIDDIRKKGVTDLVTEADIESEREIIDSITQAYPDHSILAEESGHLDGDSAYQWMIDPLDGTTNYAHGLPICAISIAFVIKNQTAMGIVLNPFSGELFTAITGRGARLNGTLVHVSSTDRLIDALLVTGFPCDTTDRMLDEMMGQVKACLKATQGLRRPGSAALNLCEVACRRFEGFWEQDLKPWDTAAGALIVTEAGGTVTNYAGHDYDHNHKQILATNNRIHYQVIDMLSKWRTDESPLTSE